MMIKYVPSQISVRSFSSTSSLMKANLRHSLVRAVDWDKVHAGYFAVVNPLAPDSLLYLSEREFAKRLNVIESSDRAMVVIASPTDTKPSELDLVTAKTPELKTPPPLSQVKAPRYWSQLGSRLRRKFFRSFTEQGFFIPTESNLRRLLVRWLRDLWHLAGYPLTSAGWYSAYINVIPVLMNILRTQGPEALVKFLKTSLIITLRFLAKQPVRDSWEFGIGMKLKHGLPAWLPVEARATIRSGSVQGIRFWISVLYIYKVFYCPWDTFKAVKSVTSPPLVLDAPVEALLGEYREFLESYFVPKILGNEVPCIPEHDPKKPLLLTQSGPNGSPAVEFASTDARAWAQEREKPESLALCNSLRKVAEYHKDGNLPLIMEIAEKDKSMGPSRKDVEDPKELRLSKIHLLTESAGKVRPIAIPDYWTQRCLLPLHRRLFKLLERIPQDGTMSQDALMATLKNLWQEHFPNWKWSSLDISSATDMIPREVYVELLSALTGSRDYALSIMTLMTDRVFHVGHAQDWLKGSTADWKLTYGRGQPMGMLASFALLGLFHHSWIQFASHRSTGAVIQSYGVVGDDGVIAEDTPEAPVATEYLSMCSIIGIPISLPKSFSSNSLWTFLSRMVIEGGEVSPASLKEELGITGMSGRLARATRLLKRDWFTMSESSWLPQAIRYCLNPDEYAIHVSLHKRGVLSGIAQRALISILSPRVGILRQLGFSEVSLQGFLGGLLRHVSLLSSGSAVFDNTYKLPVAKKLQTRMVRVLAKLLRKDTQLRITRRDSRVNAFPEFVRLQALTVQVLMLESFIFHEASAFIRLDAKSIIRFFSKTYPKWIRPVPVDPNNPYDYRGYSALGIPRSGKLDRRGEVPSREDVYKKKLGLFLHKHSFIGASMCRDGSKPWNYPVGWAGPTGKIYILPAASDKTYEGRCESIEGMLDILDRIQMPRDWENPSVFHKEFIEAQVAKRRPGIDEQRAELLVLSAALWVPSLREKVLSITKPIRNKGQRWRTVPSF